MLDAFQCWGVGLLPCSGLIPKNKHDLAAVERLRLANYEDVEPVLADLLEWIADRNWPVARPLSDALVTVGDPLVEPVKQILRGTDSSFKEHLLRLLVIQMPVPVLALLEEELRRLSEQPTQKDLEEEVSEAAQDALDRLRGSIKHPI